MTIDLIDVSEDGDRSTCEYPRLKASTDDLVIRSVSLDDPEQGLSAGNMDRADVFICWGRVRHWEISPETAQWKIIKRLKAGNPHSFLLHHRGAKVILVEPT